MTPGAYRQVTVLQKEPEPPWTPETNADETIRVLTGSRW